MQAIASEENVEDVASDLLALEGMDDANGAAACEPKASPRKKNSPSLAVDDLVELTGMDAERAKQLIMTARAPWFA